MTSRVDQEWVQLLLRRLGQNDREIGEKIGVAQSTIWRLRNRKISKVTKYIEMINRATGVSLNDGVGLEFAELIALAEESPGLEAILIALSQFMREDARTARR